MALTLSRGLSGLARCLTQSRHLSSSNPVGAGNDADRAPLYEGHVPTTRFQKTLLAAGSAVMALANPLRDDMVAVLGETTAGPALARMRDRMKADPVGAQILAERPAVTSESLDVDKLRTMPDGSFGREYQRHMDDLKITADTRKPVRFVDDEELAFVAQRYRETHDFVHCLVALGISEEEEMVLKWFEAEQTGLPMCYLGGTVGPLRLPADKRSQVYQTYIPWARRAGRSAAFLMNTYFEKRFDDSLEELRAELSIELPPPGIN